VARAENTDIRERSLNFAPRDRVKVAPDVCLGEVRLRPMAMKRRHMTTSA
jgi:hypothetical protein